MKIEISGKNMNVRDSYRKHIEDKLSKYEKYFFSEITAHVSLSHVRNKQIVEITIPLKNGAIVRVEEESFDMLSSIDNAVLKLDRQIRKHKTAMEKRYKSHKSIRFESIPEEEDVEEKSHSRIVRTKNFPVKPMSPEEATMQMELLEHNFFVFLNADTEQVNVVYKRKSEGYGLIEPVI